MLPVVVSLVSLVLVATLTVTTFVARRVAATNIALDGARADIHRAVHDAAATAHGAEMLVARSTTAPAPDRGVR